MPTLANQFPGLPFARRADEWLESIKEKTIQEQLEERKIYSVTIWRNWKDSDGFCLCFGFGFFFILGKKAEKHDLTLGHEIGHTFEFDLAQDCNREIHTQDYLAGSAHDIVEDFCEAFAKRWVAANDKEAITLFLSQLKLSGP